MRWALILLLAALPAFGADMPEATRAHLKLLQDRLATMQPGKARDKIAEEVARIRREYGLDRSAGASAGSSAAQQEKARQAAQARRAEEMYREELRRRMAENEHRAARMAEIRRQQEREWARQRAEAEASDRMKKEAAAAAAKKEDFISAAHAEMRRREFVKQAEEEIKKRPLYRSQTEYERAYASHLKFAQDSVAEGGLGFVPEEARQWTDKMMREKTNDQIYSIRFRYNRALKFAKTPKAEGGPGYERGYARKVALEAAMNPGSNAVEDWIKAEKAKLSRRKPASGCRGWFGMFD